MRDQPVVDVVVVGEAGDGDDSRLLAGVVGDVERPSRVGHGDAVHLVVGVVVIGYSVPLVVSAVGESSPGVTQHPDAWDSGPGRGFRRGFKRRGEPGPSRCST